MLRHTQGGGDDTAPDSPAARGLTVGGLRELLATLSSHRLVFHSERDFQHALAWQVHLHHPDGAIRLETRPLPGRPVFLDLAVTLAGRRAAIELKYLVRALTTTVNGEQFKLRDQSAQDLGRYDIVKDIARLEELVAARAADIGYAVVLSNDPLYWQPSKKPSPADAAFRLDEGRTLTGLLAWGVSAGAGTMRGREAAISLAGRYRLAWSDYSDLGVGPARRFRYLLLEVTTPAAA